MMDFIEERIPQSRANHLKGLKDGNYEPEWSDLIRFEEMDSKDLEFPSGW